MVYEVEIEGTLPTFSDYLDTYVLHGRRMALMKRDRMIENLVPLFRIPPNFDGHAYVGIVWIRPNSKEDQQSVSYAKTLILIALQRAGVVIDDLFRIADPIDLGFFFNARAPRTIIRIADSLDELYAHQESRYA